jgi:carbamoyltransferase
VALVLGIQNGHHASCALVREGVLVAAVEQERITRVKGDGGDGLSNLLPVAHCLRAAGASLDDVDLIVSSFQAMGPGGVGLHRPLVEPGFDLFNPMDERHLVISHHAAHALCALGSSNFPDAAVVVCDLAGSTTRDGGDFAASFRQFQLDVTTLDTSAPTLTECLSIYEADELELELKYREYCVPHSAPEVFVCGAASLYDNVARMIFGRENAHGELMALASMSADQPAEIDVSDILDCSSPGAVRFRNDWQHRVRPRERVLDYAPVAGVVQRAFQRALVEYARKARALTSSPRLVVAGGSFLNIVANSQIARSGLFHSFFVPSAPHDAGIAVGCAFHGWRTLTRHRVLEVTAPTETASDRLGATYAEQEIGEVLWGRRRLVSPRTAVEPAEVAALLSDGRIVARCAGRAEFGPRALGGRSLLATPLRRESKDRLNLLKGRQPWRPVAPVVLRERIADFFIGPQDSPYMNMVHTIIERHRGALAALVHPDGSARAQTLSRAEDPYLYEVIREFGVRTGYPILVNTSFNGPGEPILETPGQALDFFLASEQIDYLLLEEHLLERRPEPSFEGTRLAPDLIVTIVRPGTTSRVILLRGGVSLEVSREALCLMERMPEMDDLAALNTSVRAELVRALRCGLLVSAPDQPALDEPTKC